MNRALSLGLGQSLLIALAGCSISAGAGGAQTELFNTCTADAECGGSAVCQEHICVTTQVDLTGLLIEVRPTGASFGSSTSYLFTPRKEDTLGSTPGGVHVPFDIRLPEQVSLSEGKVKLDYASECTLPADNSYPAKITLKRVPPFGGLHFEPYILDSAMVIGAAGYEIKGGVPPGTYDVYIEPVPLQGCSEETPPPIFYARQELPRKSPIWSLPKPRKLTGSIVPPSDGDLTGWRMDVVDHDTGHVISTLATLGQGPMECPLCFELSLAWPDGTTISPYLRLRPKEGDHMPSVYWDLFGTLLGASPEKSPLSLTVGNLVTQPRPVQIQIQDDEGHGVPASVKIQSSKLIGDVATNASYESDVLETNEEGDLKTPLPPGAYRFRVTPKPRSAEEQGDTLAITETSIEVPPRSPNDPSDQCFCGHVITLLRKATVKGQISTPQGAPLVNAPVMTEPSHFAELSYWSIVHALDPLVPDPTSTVADFRGSFRLNVDPRASSDLSVRLDEESGLPWLVSPRVTPEVTDTVEVVDKGQLKLSFPAIFEGMIVDPLKVSLVGADVYAWLPVPDPTAKSGLAGTVIKIAETRTDTHGHYRLLLPTSISQ